MTTPDKVMNAYFDAAEEERNQRGRFKDIKFYTKDKPLNVKELDEMTNEMSKLYFRDMFAEYRPEVRKGIKDIFAMSISGLDPQEQERVAKYEPSEEDIDDIIEAMLIQEDDGNAEAVNEQE